MERERTNVGIFVLHFLVHTFLEVAVLLEAVFFGHSLPVFFRLDGVALTPEVAELALKHLVASELTLQRTVEERYLDAGFQANLLEALLAIAQHPSLVA